MSRLALGFEAQLESMIESSSLSKVDDFGALAVLNSLLSLFGSGWDVVGAG